MAGGQGAAAYSKLQKTDGSLSQSQQFWAGQTSQKMEREKQREFAAQQQQEKYNREDIKAFSSDEGKLEATFSGQKTLDDTVTNMSEDMTEIYTNYRDNYEGAVRSGDRVAARKWLSKKNKMMRNFNTAKEQIKAMSVHMDNFKKSAETTSDMDDRSYNAFQAIEENDIIPYTDENDNIRYKMKVEDPDTGEVIVKDFDMGEFTNGWLDPIKKVELGGKEGFVNKVLGSVGKKKRYKEEGDWVITDTKWDEKDEAVVRAEIKAFKGNPRAMADLLYQASGGATKKYEGFTSEEEEMVENYVYDRVRLGLDEDYSKKKNWQKLNYERGLRSDARAERSLAQKEKTGKGDDTKATATLVTTPSGDVDVTVRTTGGEVKYDEKGMLKQDFDQTSTKTFNINRKDEKAITGLFKNKELILESVEVDENGNFYANTSLPTSTRTGSTAKGGTAQSYKTFKKDFKELDNKELTGIAKLLGYENVKELRDGLGGQTGGSATKDQPRVNKEDAGILD